jgi:glycosyltransferase involved in cell wall biosynthesis
MTAFDTDIVVPVWNDPVATRNCLVSLAEYSPRARFILVDNGSDRETERLLQEFAEFLDNRALLMRSDQNLGFVQAANRGLTRSDAQWLVLVRNTSVVADNWLAPLVAFGCEHADAGIIVPRLVSILSGHERRFGSGAGIPVETDHGSFAAMLIRRDLFERIGGFDDRLDSGVWCLKDYSRRAWQAGYRTCSVPAGMVAFREATPLGSLSRREEARVRSQSHYLERWGEEISFCVYNPKGTGDAIFSEQWDLLLRGARQGHRFEVILPAGLRKETGKAFPFPGHENVRWHAYPAFFSTRWLDKEVARLRSSAPGTIFVRGRGCEVFPQVPESMSFAELERRIAEAEHACYAQRPA